MPETYQIPAALPEWDGGPWLTEADLRAIIEEGDGNAIVGFVYAMAISVAMWAAVIWGAWRLL